MEVIFTLKSALLFLRKITFIALRTGKFWHNTHKNSLSNDMVHSFQFTW